MTIPLRIQRKRIAGWTKPANTLCVTRPGLWSNPFIVGEPSGVFPKGMGTYGRAETMVPALTREQCVSFYADMVRGYISPKMYPHGHQWMERYHERCTGHSVDVARIMLAGKNLACWCHLCPKHENGKPLNETCADCAPCHVDPLGMIANGFACEAA